MLELKFVAAVNIFSKNDPGASAGPLAVSATVGPVDYYPSVFAASRCPTCSSDVSLVVNSTASIATAHESSVT